MNVLKTSLASLFALALISTAPAQTVIRITGSNADRPTTNTAIGKLLAGTVTVAATNADLTKANQVTWTGGTLGVGGPAVTVKVSFIGAAGGIAAVAGSLPVKFLPNGATGTSNVDPTVGTNPNEAAVPDITMSSNFPSTTLFNGATINGVTYEDISPQDNLVAVLGFKWVASKGFPAGQSISPQVAQLLFGNGSIPLALITGNAADQNKTVFATGRNLDAGLRFAAFAEAGVGINAVVRQYKPVISGAAAGVNGAIVGGTVNSQALWPIETVSGVSSGVLGNSGQSTGSNLAPSLTATLGSAAYTIGNPSATAGYYVSYLSESDADNIAIANGAVELKWNGVTFGRDAVRQGQYSFWGYEHLLYRKSLAGVPLQLANALVNQITNVDAGVAGIFLNTMVVSKPAEGGLVVPNYF
jgi:hypothetical protein